MSRHCSMFDVFPKKDVFAKPLQVSRTGVSCSILPLPSKNGSALLLTNMTPQLNVRVQIGSLLFPSVNVCEAFVNFSDT